MTDAHAQVGPMERFFEAVPTGNLDTSADDIHDEIIAFARQQDDIQRQLVEALEGCFVLGQELAGLVCGEYCAHSRDDPEDCPRNDPRLEIARAALARVREEGR